MTKKILDQKDLQIWAKHGKASAVRTWTATHIHSQGGGGSINNGSSYISAPQLTSSTTDTHEFFLTQPDGREVAIRHGYYFPVRDGHWITAIYMGHSSENNGRLIGLHNHSTDEKAVFHGSIYQLTKDQTRSTLSSLIFAFLVIASIISAIIAIYGSFDYFLHLFLSPEPKTTKLLFGGEHTVIYEAPDFNASPWIISLLLFMAAFFFVRRNRKREKAAATVWKEIENGIEKHIRNGEQTRP